MSTIILLKSCVLGEKVHVFMTMDGEIAYGVEKIKLATTIVGKFIHNGGSSVCLGFDHSVGIVPNGTMKDYYKPGGLLHHKYTLLRPGYSFLKDFFNTYNYTCWVDGRCSCEIGGVGMSSAKEIICKLPGCLKVNDVDPKYPNCFMCGNKL